MKPQINISVIIPFHNVEDYLYECVHSVLIQKNISLEIILINDGSTDNSVKIAETLKKKHDNIILINQNNEGPSSARNKGLKEAKGEYIAFIDSDDWISKESLQSLYTKGVMADADMVIANFSNIIKDNEERVICEIPKEFTENIYVAEEAFISLMRHKIYLPMIWRAIYRNEWIQRNNLYFDEGILHADELWTQKAFMVIGRLLLTNVDYYNYRPKRKGSIMNSKNINHRIDSIFYIIQKLVYSDLKLPDNSEFNNWMYVNIYRLYKVAFNLLLVLRHSDSGIYNKELDDFLSIDEEKRLFLQKNASNLFNETHKFVEEYTRFLSSDNLYIKEPVKSTIILFFNHPIDAEKVNATQNNNTIITYNHKYLDNAHWIVFDWTNLHLSLRYCNLNPIKPQFQKWIICFNNEIEIEKYKNDKNFKVFDFLICTNDLAEFIRNKIR